MRIVIAGQMPPPVGGQNLNIEKLYRLFDEDPSIEVEHWEFDFSKKVSELRRFQLSKVFSLVKVFTRLCRLRLRGVIDVIVYPSGGPQTLPIVRDIVLLPFACLVSKRVWIHFHAAGIAKRLPTLSSPLRTLLTYVYGRTHGAIVLTEYGRRDPESLGMRNVEVAPIGAVDSALPSDDFADDGERAIVILSSGHLCEDKGTDVLLKAFARIPSHYGKLKLHLVGECSSLSLEGRLHGLLESARKRGAVEVAGLLHGEKLAAAYQKADLFVFPSTAPYESYGMVLVEAMSHRLPIVAADWRAAEEVLRDPVGGICYQIGEDHVVSLTNAIGEVLGMRSEWPELRTLNRNHFEENYTIANFGQRMREIVFSKGVR